MPFNRSIGLPIRPSLTFILLASLLIVLWLAGGASRADASGQALVRASSAVLLVVFILFGSRPAFSQVIPVLLLALASLGLAVLQLVPLTPALWEGLPGRSLLADTMPLTGLGQPWRPLAIVPGATANAAMSLIVPIAVLVLVAGLPNDERRWLPGLVLVVVTMAMLLVLLQLTGAAIKNPFVNDFAGTVSGSFANRNHLALFLAFGCLLAPVWAFADGHEAKWRGAVAFGLLVLFVLTVLAIGSRVGLALVILAAGVGFLLVRQSVERTFRRYPRWVFPAVIATLFVTIAILALISFTADRALSIDRVLTIDSGQDMRSRALPTVVAMAWKYFPFGSGLGGFDPVFRMDEPFTLLRPTYLNHAHNDFLEVALDAGLPGIVLLLATLSWWAWASVRAWRAGPGMRYALPKLGSAMLFMVMVASVFDYPARTPMIMAMVVIAAVWLCQTPERSKGQSALPTRD